MEKNLYIDASHPNETRVVLKSGENIEDYEYEGLKNNLIKNNIYLGKVSRIEPSLQAAFIDFGRERHGFLSFNDIQSDYYQIPKADLEKITHKTAAVILETIQGGAGFICPTNDFLKKVKERCDAVCALLILDEIQTGIGRTGKFWGFENYQVTPDIVITGKGLGGGMPIGAFIAPTKMMRLLQTAPKLGHITTFGGHPVIAAAGLATVKEIVAGTLISDTLQKEKLIRHHLQHPAIKEIRGKGLMLAAIVDTPELAAKIILACLEKGLILFFLLFEKCAIRMTPPLTISDTEIIEACTLLKNVIDEVTTQS